MYIVIMGGGAGKRFWPKSREDNPKQFLNIAGESSMIRSTFLRACKVTSRDRVFVVTHEKFRKRVIDEIEEIDPLNVISEPEARNTAPCIALSLFYIKNFIGNENILFVPADHLIYDDAEFVSTVQSADARVLKTKKAVIFGIKPRYPETGYGYIRKGKEACNIKERSVFEVDRFVEKPDARKAKTYLETGDYFWNSGMFLFHQKKLLESFKELMPKVYRPFKTMDFGKREDFPPSGMDFYEQLEKVSIDNGIIEKEKGLELIECSFGWSDVGNWKALEEIWPRDEDGNVIRGKSFLESSKGLIADTGKKLLVTIGVSDLIIVESDDALFVCSKDQANKMKGVLDRMGKKGLKDYL